MYFFANGVTTPTNTISGGQCINSGFFSVRTTQQTGQSITDLIAQRTSITSNIQGASDLWCLAMAGSSANDDVNGTAKWLEIT
jgi:hypothetical protein